MIHVFNAQEMLDAESEANYSLRKGVNNKEYPQVHDYYEIYLVTKGRFDLIINNISYTLTKSQLAVAFPNDIHSKLDIEGDELCDNINIAISAATVNELFLYLYKDSPKHILVHKQHIFDISSNQQRNFLTSIRYFSLFRNDQKKEQRAELRSLILPLFYNIIVPGCKRQQQNLMIIPIWLQKLIDEMNSYDNLYEGIDYMVDFSGKTKEYICRSFKKYLGITPTKFLNTKKLTYAANMLQHSNREIADLSEDLGYSSLSYFYKLFKKEYGTTPKAYRKLFQYLPS
ncbi:MAG: AraC family transcriptional regulator [Spirochaetia bacterium]|jgi:AraC family cel operon transcriptional repressor|nr:AraC family transcriptional regulator [Spirochaetia bacterium]